jgi:hypothetical protein
MPGRLHGHGEPAGGGERHRRAYVFRVDRTDDDGGPVPPGGLEAAPLLVVAVVTGPGCTSPSPG